MIFTTEDGKQWEFRGFYAVPLKHQYFLNDHGEVQKANKDWPGGVRAIVHPVPKRHVFGGIVFEETGEKRHAQPMEWVLMQDFPMLFLDPPPIDYPILRPVEVVQP